MTSIQYMADKYNGVKHEKDEQVGSQTDNEASAQADLFREPAEAGNANEEAGQVKTDGVA